MSEALPFQPAHPRRSMMDACRPPGASREHFSKIGRVSDR